MQAFFLSSISNVTPTKPSETPPHRKVTGERNQTGAINTHYTLHANVFSVIGQQIYKTDDRINYYWSFFRSSRFGLRYHLVVKSQFLWYLPLLLLALPTQEGGNKASYFKEGRKNVSKEYSNTSPQ